MKAYYVQVLMDGTEVFFSIEPSDNIDPRQKITYTFIPQGSIESLGYILFPGSEPVCVYCQYDYTLLEAK